jgi:hypothetical protein
MRIMFPRDYEHYNYYKNKRKDVEDKIYEVGDMLKHNMEEEEKEKESKMQYYDKETGTWHLCSERKKEKDI